MPRKGWLCFNIIYIHCTRLLGAKKRAAAVINFADDDVQPLRITPGRQSAKRRRAVSAQDDIEAIENVGPIEAPQVCNLHLYR